MSKIRSTEVLVAAARKALKASRLPPREHFAHLVELGWIDARGRVTRLLGGTAEPEKSASCRNGK